MDDDKPFTFYFLRNTILLLGDVLISDDSRREIMQHSPVEATLSTYLCFVRAGGHNFPSFSAYGTLSLDD